MREAFLLHRSACAVLIAFVCSCASGAPESPHKRQQQAPITDPGAGADAGANDPRPEPADGAAGSAGLAAPSPVTGAASAAAQPPNDGPDASAGGADETPAPAGGDASAGAAGAGSDPNGGAGTGVAGAGPEPGNGTTRPNEPSDCFDAKLLWSDDFESNDYANWTSQGYGADWGDGCQDNGISTEAAVSGARSQRSEITCVYGGGSVHRGYGGLQFDGDDVLPAFTNQGVGIDAPHGVVNTMWIRLDSDTVFENGKWVSFFTVNGDCTWSNPQDQVLGFGIEGASGRLAAAHYQFNQGGTRTFEPNAPALPRFQWARVTTYVNYHTGVMHLWQDGQSLQHVTFSRPLQTICHFHWGLYASSNNDDVVLFEDDNSVWKLNEPWGDFSVEPYFGEGVATCD